MDQGATRPGPRDAPRRRAHGAPGVTFGPTPSSHSDCTIGGMIGNNSCGNYSIMSAVPTSDGAQRRRDGDPHVRRSPWRVGPTTQAELEAIIVRGGRRGQIYRDLRDLRDRYGPLIRQRDSPTFAAGFGDDLEGLLPERGFNLAYALVGTESTCVTVLEATLRHGPRHATRVRSWWSDSRICTWPPRRSCGHVDIGQFALEGIRPRPRRRRPQAPPACRRDGPVAQGAKASCSPSSEARPRRTPTGGRRAFMTAMHGHQGRLEGETLRRPAGGAEIWERRIRPRRHRLRPRRPDT